MAMATEAARRFTAKLNSLLDKNVAVKLSSGKYYRGKLGGFDPSSLNIILERVEDEAGNKLPLVLIAGGSIEEIIVEEESVFDAREFADYLVRKGGIGQHMVKVHDDINVVEVGKAIRVTANGVEGSGVMAQKVHTIYMEYLRMKGIKV